MGTRIDHYHGGIWKGYLGEWKTCPIFTMREERVSPRSKEDIPGAEATNMPQGVPPPAHRDSIHATLPKKVAQGSKTKTTSRDFGCGNRATLHTIHLSYSPFFYCCSIITKSPPYCRLEMPHPLRS